MNKRDIVRICRKLYERGFVVSSDGNISVRTTDGYLVTGAGTYFSEVTESEIVALMKSGKVVGRLPAGVQPSSELAMHLEVYRQREDVVAVIHAHPPYSTAFSLLGKDKIDCLLTEIKYTLGEVPIAPFATPGTEEVHESIRNLLPEHDAIILANHGLLAMGRTLTGAYWKVERVERFAKICYLAAALNEGTGG